MITTPPEQNRRQPATTPVGIDAAAVIASFPEDQRRALDALGGVFEPAAGPDDPCHEILGPLLDRREVRRLLGLGTTEEIDRLVED